MLSFEARCKKPWFSSVLGSLLSVFSLKQARKPFQKLQSFHTSLCITHSVQKVSTEGGLTKHDLAFLGQNGKGLLRRFICIRRVFEIDIVLATTRKGDTRY